MGLVANITQAVANHDGTSQHDLPPLYERLDPEALEQLVDSATDGPITIAFEYDDHTVRIDANGDIELDPTQ